MLLRWMESPPLWNPIPTFPFVLSTPSVLCPVKEVSTRQTPQFYMAYIVNQQQLS